MSRILRFALVGGVGFVADAAVLALLLATHAAGARSWRACFRSASRLPSRGCCNRHLTFEPSRRGLAVEGARYGGVGIATSVLNYLVYCGLLLALPGLPALVALALASATAMALSYLGYSRLVFDR